MIECAKATDRPFSIGVIGAGKVGGTLARLWHRRGYTIAAVYSRTDSHARALAQAVGAEAVSTPESVIASSDLTLLTVPDDAIVPLAEALTGSSLALAGKGVIHTAGAHDAGVLAALAAKGAHVGSLHPSFPFTDVGTAVDGLSGAAFAVEAEDGRLRGWLLELVATLDGHALAIPAGGKVLYHAALAIASNYTVTLYALAERLLMSLGVDREDAGAALNPLVAATIDNLRTQGIPNALPGPLTRADVGTIAAHLRALEQVDEQIAIVYRQLARLSFPMLVERGIAVDGLERLLAQEQDHENDNT
jgi:predicted short-subunit dehydrogenase-like oxidoreductase (DUF2520 family)